MKKIIFLLAFLFATITYAQTPARHYGGVILGSFVSDPTGVMEGQIYWNTTDNKFRAYDGSVWFDLVGGTGLIFPNREIVFGNGTGVESNSNIQANGNAGYIRLTDGFNTSNLYSNRTEIRDNTNVYGSLFKDHIRFYDGTAFTQEIDAGVVTANTVLTMPDASGTIALTSDIPTLTLQDVTDNGNTTDGDLVFTDLGNINFEKSNGVPKERLIDIESSFDGISGRLKIKRWNFNAFATDVMTIDTQGVTITDNFQVKEKYTSFSYLINSAVINLNRIGASSSPDQISTRYVADSYIKYLGTNSSGNLTFGTDINIDNNDEVALTSDLLNVDLQDVLDAGSTWISSSGFNTLTIASGGEGSLTFKNTDENWGYNIGSEEWRFTDGSGNSSGKTYITTTEVSIGNNTNRANLNSTNITADRDFEFPDASGTFALTSDITDVSEWAESTGTRSGGDLLVTLGDYDNSDIGTKLIIDNTNDYVKIESGNGLFSSQGFNIGTNPLSTFGSLQTNTLTSNRVYDFPDASGTVALTSDIESYSEWAEYSGTRSGGDLVVLLGDYDEIGGATNIEIDDANFRVTLRGDTNVESSVYTSGHFVLGDMDSTYKGFLQRPTYTASRTWYLPDATGTVALTSDLPTSTDFVDLTTAQTISGDKTFTNPTTISNSNYTTGFSNTFSFLDNNTTLNTTISANETYNQSNTELTYSNINSSGDITTNQITTNYNANSSSSGGEIKGQQINTNVDTQSQTFRVYGLNNEVKIESGLQSVTEAWGIRSDLYAKKSGGTLNAADILLTTGSGTTFNEVYGLSIDPFISSSTTINNTFHLLDLKDAFINASATLPTDSYSIYSDVNLPSYFNGDIELGTGIDITMSNGNITTANGDVYVAGGKVHTGSSGGSSTIEQDDLKLVSGSGSTPQVKGSSGAITHAISFDVNGGSNTTLSTPNGYVGEIAVAHEKTPQIETGSAGGNTSSTDGKDFYYLAWTGGNGNETFNLPSATTNQYRTLQFITNNTVTANKTWTLDGFVTETIDGSATYVINREYEGIKLWSDGAQWIIIQAKK